MGLIEFPTSAMRGQMKSSSTRNRDRGEKVRFEKRVLGMNAGMVCVGRGPSAKRSGQGRPRTRGAQGEGKMDKEKGEGGIYVWRKRRGAAPARFARLGGRQTWPGEHQQVNNANK